MRIAFWSRWKRDTKLTFGSTLCSHLVRSTPLVESYGPPEKPFVPSPEALAKNKKRRFRLRLPLLLRPTTYPFSRPVSLLVICFLPIALPLSVGFLITRFALQGRESRKRIATARKEKGEGREGMLMRVGVRIGEIAEQVGGDNPEYAADLETSETEEGSYESERDQGTGGDGNGNGNGEASERRVVGTRTPASAASTPRTSSAASSARSSSPLIPVSSASPAPSAGAPATTRGPAPTAATLAEARKLRTDPALSPSQLFQLEHLNAIPQLRKHYVYLPHARNAHGAIVRRDPAIAMHREGKKVVDAWVSGFEV